MDPGVDDGNILGWKMDPGVDDDDVAGGKLDPGVEGQWEHVARGPGSSMEHHQMSTWVEL